MTCPSYSHTPLCVQVDDLVALLESKLLVSVVEEVEAPCWALGKDPTGRSLSLSL
jgi:hypothetical protein